MVLGVFLSLVTLCHIKLTFRILVLNLQPRILGGRLIWLEGSSELTRTLDLTLLGLAGTFFLFKGAKRHGSHLVKG
jgi:hypothetical protein